MGAIIAVDIGGTHLRAALYEPDNTLPIVHQRVRTHAEQPGVYGRMEALITAIWPQDREVTAIGVAWWDGGIEGASLAPASHGHPLMRIVPERGAGASD